MKTLMIAVLVAVFAIGYITSTHRHHIRCTEDMACWNCHTMGNKICGPGH